MKSVVDRSWTPMTVKIELETRQDFDAFKHFIQVKAEEVQRPAMLANQEASEQHRLIVELLRILRVQLNAIN